MAKKDAVRAVLSNNDIRGLMLQYFYERNKNATSVMGKKGSAVKISEVKSELKASHGLTQAEVQSNLTYLLSQGWVEEKDIQKQFRTKAGTVMPSVTTFYQITAAGIDKIEGPGEFTMSTFYCFWRLNDAVSVAGPRMMLRDVISAVPLSVVPLTLAWNEISTEAIGN